MSRKPWMLVLIILMVIAAAVVVFKDRITIMNPATDKALFDKDVSTRLGLDLRGGLQTLLEVPQGYAVTGEELSNTRNILMQRANALGVSEVTMNTAGDRRIVAEFPGISNPDEAISSLQQTGLLEFVEMGTTPPGVDTTIKTDYNADPNAQAVAGETIYKTIMTGAALKAVSVQRDQTTGEYAIAFELKPEQADLFKEYTTNHVGQILGIVLDKRVISTPRIDGPIPSGKGQISGSFTRDGANILKTQLQYGSLPVPVVVVDSRAIGPTLGAESVRKSILAGGIGFLAVIIFMILYYRLPGVVATLALICYALFSMALFELIPVVLTLAGIAGFILSIGMAVDANILIFERMKEELRAGRNLTTSIDLGWRRAWTSIRDSNISTLITCTILYFFGSAFGASIVQGFALTLGLGVLVSLFTAIVVTRTFLHFILDNVKLAEHPRWFGI